MGPVVLRIIKDGRRMRHVGSRCFGEARLRGFFGMG